MDIVIMLMKGLKWLISFGLGYAINLLLFSNLILPIIYSVPKSIYLFVKGRVYYKAVFMPLLTPAIWIFLIILIGFTSIFIKPLYNFLHYNDAFSMGGVFALVGFIMGFFSPDTRRAIREDYEIFIEPYKKTSY